MSKHRPPCSLYSMSLERMQLLIADYAVHLAFSDCKTVEIQDLIADWKGSTSGRLPRKILEDITNTFDGAILKSSRELCFFYLLTLRPDFQRLAMSRVNSNFTIYELNELFVRNTFDQLTWLDCGGNCTDQVLYLISLNCPNLEYLNASSRRNAFIVGSNATLLHDRITDIGIELIANSCRKLKTIVMNDPRNGGDVMMGGHFGPYGGGRRQSMRSISTSAYRLLLRSISNLEFVSYSNIGGIVATELQDLSELNLRLIQHYNPTGESIREILRLCRKLEMLNLVSFVNCPENQTVLEAVIQGHPPLTSINLKNMTSRSLMTRICDTFSNLTELNVTESFEYLTVDNLVVIGETLPYLKHLHLIGYCHESDASDTFKRHKFLGQLETLTMSFIDQYSEAAFQFCVSQSEHSLRHCKLTEDSPCERNMVRRLMERHSFPELYELVLYPGFLTTMEEVLDLITHFPKLEQFTGWCLGDISPIACLIQEHNLNFTFTNIKRRSLLD